jgi:Flp pilus assembly protein TadB
LVLLSLVLMSVARDPAFPHFSCYNPSMQAQTCRVPPIAQRVKEGKSSNITCRTLVPILALVLVLVLVIVLVLVLILVLVLVFVLVLVPRHPMLEELLLAASHLGDVVLEVLEICFDRGAPR